MILLVGAGGMLGQEIAAAAHNAGLATRAFPRQELDITEAGQIRAAIAATKPDLIINAAAYTKVDQAESEPETAWRINADGPAKLAECAGQADIPIVHFSTDYVFAGDKGAPYVEDDPIGPLGVYGKSKAAGESAIRERSQRHWIFRTAWLYSGRGGNFVRTIVRLAAERNELRVVSDQTGSPTSAKEVARAITSVINRLMDRQAPYGTYHLVGTGTASWFDLASRIVQHSAELTGRRPAVVPIPTTDYPTAAIRPKNSALDASRFAERFGLRLPRWQDSVDDAVREIIETGKTS